ncbi:MAG: Fe-S cluster assembly protein HesB, partial [Nannocystaceae bacterium]
GRLLRAPTLFEDQLKILFTTNCTWTNTQHMSAALVDALGARGPTGRRAFPSAAVCARKSPAWWRARIRVGYRAEACAHLSRLAAKGDDRLDPTARAEPTRDVRALRKALQERPGFGPYAAGQALRLLGHYDDLALDAAVRSHLSEGRSDAELCADYTSFGAFAGLALWMDFSRRWLDHPKVPAPVRKGRR